MNYLYSNFVSNKISGGSQSKAHDKLALSEFRLRTQRGDGLPAGAEAGKEDRIKEFVRLIN